jgi:hypothetical protein
MLNKFAWLNLLFLKSLRAKKYFVRCSNRLTNGFYLNVSDLLIAKIISQYIK